MSLRDKIKNKKFIHTVELEPPKGIDAEEVFARIDCLKSRIDAFNVTDMQSANMRASSWAMCAKLKEKGFEPVLQMTARDRNIIAIQGDLLGSYMLGIEDVMLLTGDSPLKGDHPQARAVFEVDSVKMINMASRLNSGFDLAGNTLSGKPNFFIGAALNPFASDRDKELKKMEAKIKAGVSFFQTQPVFDIDIFNNFLKDAAIDIPVIAGIIFIKSFKMAKHLQEKVSGIEIPKRYIEKLSKADSFKEESLDISRDITKGLKDICSGIHFMPFGWYDEILKVI